MPSRVAVLCCGMGVDMTTSKKMGVDMIILIRTFWLVTLATRIICQKMPNTKQGIISFCYEYFVDIYFWKISD